jgi:hypothetical protein
MDASFFASMKIVEDVTTGRLPGKELIERGLTDLERGVESIESLLVSIGAPRLRALGVHVPEKTFVKPELRLYDKLAYEYGNGAHSRYNALVRRLVSYERALCVG